MDRLPPFTRSVPAFITGKAPWGPYASELEAHTETRAALAAELPDSTPAALQMLQGIAWAESRYGITPDWQRADGTPSWNFGALVARGGEPSLVHGDKTSEGVPTHQGFAVYLSRGDGMRALAGPRGMGPSAVHAASTGNADRVAQFMYDRHYYTGTSGSREDRIRAYAGMLVGSSRIIAGALGEPLLVLRDMGPIADPPAHALGARADASPASAGRGALALVAGVGVVLWGLTR